jgi:hypothetical protein
VRRLAVALALAAAAVAGCSDEPGEAGAPEGAAPEGTAPESAARDKPASNAGPESRGGRSPSAERLEPARCPPSMANCRTASGRVLYVERVDPDGDGDAHFVLASRQAITAPGLSVVDVKRSLRPEPLPGPGDRLSAAGPVYTGSHGQSQIEAIELHVAR